MKPFEHMTEPELAAFFRSMARMIQDRLPPGELFCLMTFGDKKIGQYASNAQRPDIIKILREFADGLEAHDDVTR